MTIIRNAIRCNRCGDEIESLTDHDFKTCSCGTCAVDGGKAYLKRLAPSKDSFTELALTIDEGDDL